MALSILVFSLLVATACITVIIVKRRTKKHNAIYEDIVHYSVIHDPPGESAATRETSHHLDEIAHFNENSFTEIECEESSERLTSGRGGGAGREYELMADYEQVPAVNVAKLMRQVALENLESGLNHSEQVRLFDTSRSKQLACNELILSPNIAQNLSGANSHYETAQTYEQIGGYEQISGYERVHYSQEMLESIQAMGVSSGNTSPSYPRNQLHPSMLSTRESSRHAQPQGSHKTRNYSLDTLV